MENQGSNQAAQVHLENWALKEGVHVHTRAHVCMYTWYSATLWITTAEVLMYGTCSQGISQFFLHTHTFICSQNEPYLRVCICQLGVWVYVERNAQLMELIGLEPAASLMIQWVSEWVSE